MKGARELSPRSLTYFRELVGWRESIARKKDKAPFRVIGNEQLLALACDPPSTVADLSRIRGASPGLFEERGVELVEVAQGVRALPDSALAAFPQHSGARDLAFEARFTKLKAVRALVPDFQLSLAIGKEGQNARLAAKLTGSKIDIQPDSVMDE